MRKITQSDARVKLLLALERLSNCDNSPLKRLTDEFYPKWRAAFANPDSGYISAKQRTRAGQTARAVLVQWASACNLVEADSGSPQWLVDYAGEYLDDLEERNRSATVACAQDNRPLGFHPRDSPPVAPTVRLSPPWSDLDALPGETWVQYKRRVCKVLRARWRARQKRQAESHITDREKVQPNTAEIDLDHSEWFILYQCCGLKLKQIVSRSGFRRGGAGANQTIWQGVQSIAKRAGLKVVRRRSGVKKSTH